MVRRPMHSCVRRFVLVLAVGVVLACLSAWLPAGLLKEPSLSYSARLMEYAELHDHPKRCFWLRVWRAPYGCHVQVAVVGRIESEPYPLAMVEYLPAWSRVRAAWPARGARCDEAIAQHHAWMEAAFGWPWPALATAWMMDRNTGATVEGSVEWGIPILKYRLPPPRAPFSRRAPAVLPLRPYGPGFLANTALYAVVVAGLVYGPLWLRGRLRRRRGRCPACGYNLRASPERCPECGRPTRPSVVPRPSPPTGASPRV